MSKEDKLEILKMDLGIVHQLQDGYLGILLDTAARFIQKEGIHLTESIEDTMLQIMYAAYLYRHRAEKENAMPRMLRYALNNRLLSEKMASEKEPEQAPDVPEESQGEHDAVQ